tara:strand:+ start:37 stop:243 length:207 start_codon:yes stop_codon:yes gene_type:complete
MTDEKRKPLTTTPDPATAEKPRDRAEPQHDVDDDAVITVAEIPILELDDSIDAEGDKSAGYDPYDHTQ